MPGADHISRLLAGLDAERQALVRFDRELAGWSLPQRIAAGAALGPLDVVTVEHRSRDRVNVVLRGKDLHDGFAPGDPVTLGPVGRPENGVHGRFEGGDESSVELRVEAAPEGKGPWAVVRRLDLRFLDDMVGALNATGRGQKALHALLLGSEAPYRSDPLPHPAFAGLNPSQRAAAELAMGATEVGLIHGPPGTGKTETLVAVLKAMVDLGERPWALAESNAAVDQLAFRAHAAGLDVVRLGVSARVGTRVIPLTLEHRILNGARAGVLATLRRDRSRASDEAIREIDHAIREEWQAAKREILQNAHVLALTLGSLRTRGADLPNPRTAVVDEASQAWEPAIWQVALRCKRLILAGDPQQLGPVVKSQHPALERSLLARLVDEGFPFPMLTTQYRMNTVLQAGIAPMYAGRLTADPSVADRVIEVVAPPWTDTPFRWVDTAGMGLDEEREPTGSLHNPGELDLVERAVTELISAGVAPSRIAVITPYSAQLARIRARLPQVESGTVNAFQGREQDVVIATFVRSNSAQELGFVADVRRLTVTLSRAKLLFIGVGDCGTLGINKHYAALMDYAASCGGYLSGWEL